MEKKKKRSHKCDLNFNWQTTKDEYMMDVGVRLELEATV